MAFLLQRTFRLGAPVAPFGGSLNFAVRALSVSPSLQLKRPIFKRELPPKRAPNAYMLYLMDNSQVVPKTENGKLNLKAIGEMWRKLSVSEAKPYHDKAKVEQVKYKQRYETFLRSIGGPSKQEIYLEELREYRADKREYLKNFRLKKQDLLKPRKKSGYNLFVAELMKESKVSSLEETQEIMKGAALKWNGLTVKAKDVYNAEAQAIHEQELKSYERRYKKAEKSGLVPRRLAGGEKAKSKTTKTTAKKGTTMKKTTAVNKTIAALLKNDDAKNAILKTLQSQGLGAESDALAAALQGTTEDQDTAEDEEVATAATAADSPELAVLDEGVAEGVTEGEVLDAIESAVAEESASNDEDIFTDSDSEEGSPDVAGKV